MKIHKKSEKGIYKRCDCSPWEGCPHYWYIRYKVNGKVSRKATKTRVKREAIKMRDAIYGDIARKRFHLPASVGAKEISFSMFCRAYIERYAKVYKKSWKRDVDVIKALSAFFDNRPISSIKPFDVEAYKRARISGKIALISEQQTPYPAKSTVNKEIGTLKSMYNKLPLLFDSSEYNLNFANPVKGIKLFSINDQRIDFLEPEQIKALLDACNKRLRPIVLTAITTGMRKSNITQLKWNQVDLDRGLIYIPEPKGGAPEQKYITEALDNVLRGLQAERSGSEYVFLASSGQPYTDIRRVFNFALEKSGIAEARRQAGKKPFRFHDLRHVFASWLAMDCKDLNVVKNRLGHKDVRVTMRYAHLAEQYERNAVSNMSSRMII